MKVKAATGVRVPLENQPHSYITDAQAVEVNDTLYYQRRLADGDLVLVTEEVQTVNSGRRNNKAGEQNDTN